MAFIGKTFITTGGASGLGEAAVKRLAALGSNVAILDRNESKGKKLVEELGSSKAEYINMDATNEDSIKKAVDNAYKRFGRIDGAINSAGIFDSSLTVDNELKPHDSKVFDSVIKTNVYGTFNTCKYAASYIGKNKPDKNGLRGVLINVSSIAAMDGQQGCVAYSASKGAINAMTLPMARDLGRLGIRVMTICPGPFETPMLSQVDREMRKGLESIIVAPSRVGTPQEFALLVTQIIENTYLNAEMIRLDAGIRLGYQ